MGPLGITLEFVFSSRANNIDSVGEEGLQHLLEVHNPGSLLFIDNQHVNAESRLELCMLEEKVQNNVRISSAFELDYDS